MLSLFPGGSFVVISNVALLKKIHILIYIYIRIGWSSCDLVSSNCSFGYIQFDVTQNTEIS